MLSLHARLKSYRTIQARINIIDLDIELKTMRGHSCKELLKLKRLLIEEEAYVDSLLEKLNEQELFFISILYNTNIRMTNLARLLGIDRSTAYRKLNLILEKLRR